MSKILSIKGHPTRGNEIIALLEMMGGYTDELIDNGTDEKYAYFIVKDENNAIDAFPIDKKDEFDFEAQIFTLEEFLEKYPYKIGDKIPNVWGNSCTVKSMSWDENYKTVMYGFEESIFIARGDELKSANDMCNIPSISECKKTGQGTYAIKIADGYKFDSIDENGNIIVKSIEPKYPATYKECCDVLSLPPYYNLRYYTFEHGYSEYAATYELCSLQDKLNTLSKLLICYNAYRKIAGEQMGLDKPWKPDWSNDDETKFCIYTTQNIISLDIFGVDNRILAFPTEELRDIFYNNFKHLIEQTKELL